MSQLEAANDETGPPVVAAVRHEERLQPEVETLDAGSVRIRKQVESRPVSERVQIVAESGDVERVGAGEGDSGEVETLEDGALSIPVFEEQLVIEKRWVVRERIIVRKTTTVEEHVVRADLQQERVQVEADPAVADRVVDARPSPPSR